MAISNDAPFVISRKEAIARGMTWYFLKPCVHGHLAKRLVSRGKACLECKRLRQAVVRSEQADKVKAQKAASYLRHRDEVIASVVAYTEANRDKVYLRRKRHREANKETLAERMKEWSKANRPLLRVHERRRRDRKRGATGSHTYADIQAIGAAQGWRCAYCTAAIAEAHHIDHYVPLALGGTNDPANIRLACEPCNLSKGAKHPDDWLRRPAPSSAAAY